MYRWPIVESRIRLFYKILFWWIGCWRRMRKAILSKLHFRNNWLLHSLFCIVCRSFDSRWLQFCHHPGDRTPVPGGWYPVNIFSCILLRYSILCTCIIQTMPFPERAAHMNMSLYRMSPLHMVARPCSCRNDNGRHPEMLSLSGFEFHESFDIWFLDFFTGIHS